MKKKLSLLLCIALLAAIPAAYSYSPDITQSNAELKILEGDENGDLKLDDYVTRAEMAKIVTTLYKDANHIDILKAFSDIENHWGKSYIEQAAALSLVNGFEDGSFRPDDNVTYEQAIKMIIGGNDWSSYPVDYISFALENELLENVNALQGEYISRGDVVQIITNLIGAIKEDGIESYSSYPGVRILCNKYAPDPDNSSEIHTGGMVSSSSVSKGYVGGSGSASTSVAPGVAASDSVAMESASLSGGGGSSYNALFIPDSPADIEYFNTESYTANEENIFKNAALSPLSTFSIDTDTASYSNLRRFAFNGQTPPTGSVRTEELINYFDYSLPQPTDETPFSVTTEVASCPWNTENTLAMINIQGEEIIERQPQNLIFLLDVSGSMYSRNKLPLVKRSMELLLSKLDKRDTISIVTYANGVNVMADGISASDKEALMDIIGSLRAGGGTNGAGGIQLAYEQAEKHKCEGNNRIILCTDGDFNIGVSDNDELKKMIQEKRDNNIFISVLGFGMGNYKDDKMELIADNGDGGYYYIDSLREAKKVLSDEMTSTLYTIAKDVKIQVEFNPAQVDSYRLIGYENRVLQTEEFADDTVDAGELGAGASVTAFYEIVPAKDAKASPAQATEELRYQDVKYSDSSELMTVKLRYKLPVGGDSILKEYPVNNALIKETSNNFRFACAVAELGMLLNDSEYKGNASYDTIIELARNALGNDELGFRREFVQMVDLLRFIGR